MKIQKQIDLGELATWCKVEYIEQLCNRFQCSQAKIYSSLLEAKKLFNDPTLGVRKYNKNFERIKESEIGKQQQEFMKLKAKVLNDYALLYKMTKDAVFTEEDYINNKDQLLETLKGFANDLQALRYKQSKHYILMDQLEYEELFVSKELWCIHKVITQPLLKWFKIQTTAVLDTLEYANPLALVNSFLREDLAYLQAGLDLTRDRFFKMEDNIKQANDLIL